MYLENQMLDEKYLLNMNHLKQLGFQLYEKIIIIFTVYGQLEVLSENEFEENYLNMR